MRLSNAQAELMAELPCYCVSYYPPAKKLVEMELAQWSPLGIGRLLLTDKGIEYRKATP